MRDERRDEGSALVLTVLTALAVMGAATLALIPVTGELIDRQRARTAADAAALAGTTGGRELAAQLAAANGGALVAWSESGHTVTVTVRVGDRTAVARATDEP